MLGGAAITTFLIEEMFASPFTSRGYEGELQLMPAVLVIEFTKIVLFKLRIGFTELSAVAICSEFVSREAVRSVESFVVPFTSSVKFVDAAPEKL